MRNDATAHTGTLRSHPEYGMRSRMRAPSDSRRIDAVKLRLKIGGHEFQAEGACDVVAAHLETWKSLAGFGVPPSALPAAPATEPARPDAGDAVLRQLLAVDAERKLITLRISPKAMRHHGDVALLLLYGYGRLLNADGTGAAVASERLEASLAVSGRRVQRLDRALTRHMSSGWVRKSGRHKHVTYALTPVGEQSAAAFARQLAGGR